ncbi:MAG: hypothetical protein PHP06_06775 [Clostridia bacterium]|nr:hypothetical protein [Clostridia bacterium]
MKVFCLFLLIPAVYVIIKELLDFSYQNREKRDIQKIIRIFDKN